MPTRLKVVLIIFLVFGLTSFFLRSYSSGEWQISNTIAKGLADLALWLTLAALVYYVYFTYLLARDAWSFNAAFAIVLISTGHYWFLVTNRSKQMLECWCDLHATVLGQPALLGGFYSGQHPMLVQSDTIAQGHFKIEDILQTVNQNMASMRTLAEQGGLMTNLLRLEVEFWYYPVGQKRMSRRTPIMAHYYDFLDNKLVYDV
jgi:hypothetical protein